MEVEATREHEYPTMDRKAYKVMYPYTYIRSHVAAAILGAEKGLAMDPCKGRVMREDEEFSCSLLSSHAAPGQGILLFA